MYYERPAESTISYAVSSHARKQGERESFLQAFYVAARDNKPTKRLELACLLHGVSPDTLSRIRELAAAKVWPAYSPGDTDE